MFGPELEYKTMFFKNKQEATDPTTEKKNQGMRLKNSHGRGIDRGIDLSMGVGICSDQPTVRIIQPLR